MKEPAYNNQALFSTYHLEKVVIEQTSSTLESAYEEIKKCYTSVAEFAENLNESQTEEQFIRPVLKNLGHIFAVQPVLRTSQGTKQPDYVFFTDQESLERVHPQINTNAFFNTAIAIGDAKAWTTNLDKKLEGAGDPFSNSNPNFQIDFYIRTSELTWGILTSGKLWRLYHRDTSYKLDCFYEVDLEKILIDENTDAFRYFYYFFRGEAFALDASNRNFLDDVLTGSVHYTVAVSDDLGDKIYLALEELINGFISYSDNNLSSSDAEVIYENCLILLYRLLFVLYAESRGLLPLENSEYRTEYSLDALAIEIHDKLDSSSIVPELRSDYWTRLQNLFTLIDKGWAEHIPQYNGGLFNPERHMFLETNKIGNNVLARVVNILTRTTERESIVYQDLAIQHLGNIYEGLLEYKPSVKDASGKVQLIRNKDKRKASGSYYTSDPLVRTMVENALDPLCKRKTFEEILQIKVLDPAMGSGHFLVGVIDHLALELATHPNAPPMTTGDDDTEIAYWRRRVVENCIYGIDINPMAVELAKVSLWLHTVAKGKPLSFLDHHIRCGNSLIGAKIANLAYLPTPTKRHTDETTQTQVVFDMDLGFTHTVSEAVGHYLVIEKMESQTADNIHTMEQELEQAQQTLSRHKEIADLWLSVHFGNTVERSDYHAILDALSSHQTEIPTNLQGFRKAQELADQYHYFHWEIEFPEVFRDEFGNELENPGFDAILGNPPYGAKLDADEKAYLKMIAEETQNTNSAALFIDAAKNRLMKSDGVLAFIVPKSLLFVEKWHSLMFALLEKTRVLIDVGTSFKNVRLEQVVFVYDAHYDEDFYTARKFVDETWIMKTCVAHSYPKQFQAWICDVSLEEIQLGLKLNQIGMFMRDISDTKRGLSWQSWLNKSGDIPVIGGKNIIRYGTDSTKGFIDSENLDASNAKVEFLQNPKVMSQRIIAHIEDPKPHIKITTTVDQTGDILSVDTIINTVLTDENFTPIFISAILNSELISWYVHKFIFSSAIRTMDFDKYYVGKIPIPIATPEEQQPIVNLVEEIMEAKRKNLGIDLPTKEQEIDELVYGLYRLTKAERKIVKSSIGQ